MVAEMLTDYRFWIAIVIFVVRLYLVIAQIRVVGRGKSLVNIEPVMDKFRTVAVTIQNRKDSAITVAEIELVRDSAIWRYVLGKIIVGVDAFEDRKTYTMEPESIEETTIKKGSAKSFYFEFDRQERSMGVLFWELLNPTMISVQVAGYQILKRFKFVEGPILTPNEASTYRKSLASGPDVPPDSGNCTNS